MGLTQGFWPSQKQRDLQLSHEMRDAKSAFNTWYTERHSHRVLSWVYILGDVVVKGNFGGRSYDMTMTTFQAMALLAFACKKEAVAFPEICAYIKISQKACPSRTRRRSDPPDSELCARE